MTIRFFEVLYGPVDQPVDEWDVQHTFSYDDAKPKAVVYYDQNTPPDMIQEYYVRRNNWELEYQAKNFPGQYPLTHRWIMRQVPEDQNYKARAEKNGWDIWELSYHPYNMARLSEDKTEVTYYPTEKEARLDRPKTVKAVTYMRTVRGVHDEDDIAHYCSRYGIPYASEWELRFATTREEVRHVYVNGPRSCMSGENDMPYYGFHPTEVYACAPIAVAYMVSKNDPDHIAARTVVNMKSKGWIRIYGAHTQMERLLREAGYSRDPYCLQGHALLRIEATTPDYRGTYPMPYADYYYVVHRVSSCGNFWLVDMTAEEWDAKSVVSEDTAFLNDVEALMTGTHPALNNIQL